MLFGIPEYQCIMNLRDRINFKTREAECVDYEVDEPTCLEIAQELNRLGKEFGFRANLYDLKFELTEELQSHLDEVGFKGIESNGWTGLSDELEHISCILEDLIQAALQFSDANNLGLKILMVSSQPEFWDVINGEWMLVGLTEDGSVDIVDNSPKPEKLEDLDFIDDDDLPVV